MKIIDLFYFQWDLSLFRNELISLYLECEFSWGQWSLWINKKIISKHFSESRISIHNSLVIYTPNPQTQPPCEKVIDRRSINVSKHNLLWLSSPREFWCCLPPKFLYMGEHGTHWVLRYGLVDKQRFERSVSNSKKISAWCDIASASFPDLLPSQVWQ